MVTSRAELIADAEAKREAAAQALYTTSKRQSPVAHASREKAFNEANQKLYELRGNKKPYVYQNDVREEFIYEIKTVRMKDGSERRVEIVRGPLYSTDSIVNWRHSKIGESADNKLRRDTRNELAGRHNGDHVGHRVAMSFGADPAMSDNVGMQDGRQNIGTWRKAEKRAGAMAKQNGDGPLTIEVREEFTLINMGEQRSIARSMVVADQTANTSQNRMSSSETS
ncbi:MAG: hypothetical protein R3C10_23780 [Pirellulales bacterium]